MKNKLEDNITWAQEKQEETAKRINELETEIELLRVEWKTYFDLEHSTKKELKETK